MLYLGQHLKLKLDSHYLTAAFCLMLVTVLMPIFFTEQSFHIYEYIFQALESGNIGILMEGAFRLLILNILRSAPDYLGMLMVMEGLHITWDQKNIPFIKIPICFFLHVILYHIINRIYGIRLDVGVFVLLIFVCIELLSRFFFRLHNKMFLILLFLISCQGLDLMPGMTDVGFGNGEISLDVKMAAQVLEGERLLGSFSFLLFFSFAITTLLMVLLDREQRQTMQVHQQANQARMKNLEMRSFLEIQNLVHDLKSPLTAIQGLAELTESQLEVGKLKEYQQRIVRASERMSNMISEILYEDRKTLTTTDHLIQATLSYMAANPKAALISVDNRCPDTKIYVNSIRMSRALVNLLENACHFISQETGSIFVTITKTQTGTQWEVRDNGSGIRPEILEGIWHPGYSGNGSTGLGLGFVQQVVNLHHGKIRIESKLGEYTRVVLTLPDERSDSDVQVHSLH